jgi:hypothetical protein
MADDNGARSEPGWRAALADHRQLAVFLARARVGLGAGLLLGAGLSARLTFGSSNPGARAALRLTGARDLALGLGALTSVKERTQDAEWVSMGALVDGVDAVVLLTTPRLPFRARLVGVTAAVTAVVGLRLSQRLADERADSDQLA